MEMVATVGVNSVTKYNWGWPFEEDYVSWGTKAMQRREQWTQALDSLGVPFFPNASIGWDDSPRFPNKKADEIVHIFKPAFTDERKRIFNIVSEVNPANSSKYNALIQEKTN